MKSLIPYLLHNANRSPYYMSDKEHFYKIKHSILKRKGQLVAFEIQTIPGKECYSCDGTGWYKYYDFEGRVIDSMGCFNCTGGWYKLPQFNVLRKYKYGKYIFHIPAERFKTMIAAQEYAGVKGANVIKGYIDKGPANDRAVFMFYCLFAPVKLVSFFMNRLGTHWCCKARHPWRILNNIVALWKRQFWRDDFLLRCGKALLTPFQNMIPQRLEIEMLNDEDDDLIW